MNQTETQLHNRKKKVPVVFKFIYTKPFLAYQELTCLKDKVHEGSKSALLQKFDLMICCRIIYLMKKNIIFICFALKLCDIVADK